MHDDEKLVTIEKFDTGFDAEPAKLTLENAGIEAVVLGDNLPVNLPEIEAVRIDLQVFEKDVERARQVLAEKNEWGEDENIESDQ